MDTIDDTPVSPGCLDGTSRAMKPPNHLLCLQCQNWDDIWTVESEYKDEQRRSLEHLSHNVQCLICQTVVSAINTRRSAFELLVEWPASRILVQNMGPFFLDGGTYPPESASRMDTSDATQTIIRLLVGLNVNFVSADSLKGRVGGRSYQIESEMSISPQFLLRYSRDEKPHLMSIELWEVPFFDVSLIRDWLRGCEEVHRSQCIDNVSHKMTQAAKLPKGFRVIDVQMMKVVRPPDSARFVALSYMWEQGGAADHVQLENENLAQLELLGGLSKVALPNIISDAICLCRDLGESYLWVDRLCIIQDNDESKRNQIQHMDKIYNSAIFTIVGALNSRDGQGLPGYHGRPRQSSIWSPPREGEVEGRGIKQNSMEALVDSSLWNKRGWTFQERILSKRCLFITDFQVIFKCSQGQASEEMTYIPQAPALEHSRYDSEQDPLKMQESRQIPAFSRPHTSRRMVNYNMTDTTSLLEYFHWVKDYTSRHLSYGTDILNAFAGVGNALSQYLDSKLIFCLPEKYFTQALMWSCYGVAGSRADMPHIPSWSWASSSEKADYHWILGRSSFDKDMLEVVSLVYFHFQDPDSSLRKLDIQERWVTEEMAIQEFEGLNEIPTHLTSRRKYLPGAWRTTKTWQECPHNPWQTITHKILELEACRIASTMPGCLVFNTTIASLYLKRDTRDIYKDGDSCEQDVSICNKNGDIVGFLNKMSPEWINENVDSEKTFDFIVLCGALADWSSRKSLAQFVGDFELWRLHVILVERLLPSGPYALRRVDAGIINAHRWKDCSPRWETVVLT